MSCQMSVQTSCVCCCQGRLHRVSELCWGSLQLTSWCALQHVLDYIQPLIVFDNCHLDVTSVGSLQLHNVHVRLTLLARRCCCCCTRPATASCGPAGSIP